eukprot:TRINITY_DN125519_c0_g1_i1.p1 TRINITY_DN125519_c0_g1~~TRINITY_DN125519_c0_g1_i1.p1  ORF type:complete len:305 (+),score=34.66 TRINITY_DN125519_c0_g1_i1:45-959(+)
MAPLRPDQSGSFWYLPSRTSQRHISEEELSKAFFRTTTESVYTGARAPEESRGENLLDLFNVGQRDTKYGAYQVKKAPLADRTACAYTCDYVELPLGDCTFLRNMATEFKNRSADAGKAGRKARFQHKTKYSDDFKSMTPEEMSRARQDSTKAALDLTKTIPTAGTSLLEKMSHEQASFRVVEEQEWSKAKKADKPATTLAVGQTPYPRQTSYAAQFSTTAVQKRRPTRCRSAPTMRSAPATHSSGGVFGAVGGDAGRKTRPASASAVFSHGGSSNTGSHQAAASGSRRVRPVSAPDGHRRRAS